MPKLGGVENAQTHSRVLAESLVENIYTKIEVDKMIEASFKEFAQQTKEISRRTDEMEQEMAADRARSEQEFLKIENRIEQTVNRSIYKTVSILGGLIVVLNAITVLAHYFVH